MMLKFHPLHQFGTIVRCGAFLGLCLVAKGQTTTTNKSTTSTTATSSPASPVAPVVSANFQQTLASAETFAASQNLSAAESTLTALNISQVGTASWHLETTQKLMQMAGDLAHSGSSAAALSTANLALQHLNQATTLGTDMVIQGQAQAAAGFIYLRYLGDTVSAISSYQAAVKLNPSDTATQQALTFLQNADAKLRAKIHPPKS